MSALDARVLKTCLPVLPSSLRVFCASIFLDAAVRLYLSSIKWGWRCPKPTSNFIENPQPLLVCESVSHTLVGTLLRLIALAVSIVLFALENTCTRARWCSGTSSRHDTRTPIRQFVTLFSRIRRVACGVLPHIRISLHLDVLIVS